MFSNFKNELLEQLMSNTPPNLMNIKSELEQWINGFLTAWLAEHDIVTKEEFDIQLKSLRITQKKVELLQAQLAQLLAEKAEVSKL